MKRFILLFSIIAISVAKSYSQDNPADASSLLYAYYDIKDALVSGNSSVAAVKAGEFAKFAKASEAKFLAPVKGELVKDALVIAGTDNITVQREKFASFSDRMIALAKTSKLSKQPVYVQYCPMKKSSWLSSEEPIRNPYYGNKMMTCGEVKETLR